MYYCINLLYDLFWSLPIQRSSQNRGYIKNQYIPRLSKEHMTQYSSVNQEIYGHMVGRPGGGGGGAVPSIFLGYV
jgi:hypothetical protein